VIENTQRDLIIALMNELTTIFDKIGIETSVVLEAAGTKWNFLKFKPGLGGGIAPVSILATLPTRPKCSAITSK
jgi:UDP-N-acetyl-D-mannosaminuronate dehydrogenase